MFIGTINLEKKFRAFKLKSPCHESDCIHKDRNVPIDELPCDCYEKSIFMAGAKAYKQLGIKTKESNPEIILTEIIDYLKESENDGHRALDAVTKGMKSYREAQLKKDAKLADRNGDT